jgi:diguanylate cyclase (GGDEF)-like protein
MMKWRMGLSAKFGVLIAVALLVLLAVVMVMLQRQRAMQAEVVSVGGESMRTLVISRLQKRGQAMIGQVADTLVNPLYYFDLDAIGGIAREAMRQPDVAYVVVYDTNGDIIHDGSGDIPTYGQAMDDPLAYEVVSARRQHVQWANGILDVSAPISVGDQRLGGVRIGLSLASAREDEQEASARMSERLDEIGQRHVRLIVLLMLTLAVLAGLVGLALQRTLVRPIRHLAGAAREIEAGNFGAQVTSSERQDEIGDLLRAFGRMRESISRHDRDIRRMAYTDPLTGLSNRLAFREQLDHRVVQMQGAGRQLALLFADIDDFKRVNDSLGHDAGDEVLVQFGSRIRDAVQRYGGSGAVLARFGGDEFVVLLQSDERNATDMRAVASGVAENLVTELSRPIRVQGRQVFLGTSIGITLFPEDARDAAMLMKNGDIAMYQAKVAGKNCFRFFNRAMDQAVLRRTRMETDLRGAWERGELTLHYQPVYRLADRRLVGAEALLRWQHEEQGAIAPSAFIDVAEQSGLIERIGPEVLRAACRDAATWNAIDGTQLFVSVNVSPRQLRSGDLPQQVSRALREAGLAPHALHLELTETTIITDEAQASALLSQLRAEGVRVWLDDFGTGFSGLSHLRRVPVDGVKIDRSFVSDVTRDPDDLALTTAIIAMAHSLGITVVAEGIEDEQQLDLLRQRNCDLGQGYLFGRPVAAREFMRLLGS